MSLFFVFNSEYAGRYSVQVTTLNCHGEFDGDSFHLQSWNFADPNYAVLCEKSI